ncbi:MAG: biotin/lipoyl-binding protein [Opitutales bacterium]|nr:biotin/lipoyl-binding protein [Opitutales bacterium]
MKTVDFMLTTFRDGLQSAYGARVLTPDFLPAVEAAREAGIQWFEAGGGARFQSLYFYCNEDAFDMMDRFREAAGPDANLQTLSRGVNVVALDSQSADIVDLHAKLFRKHGITSIRNFDALNDVHNLVDSARSIKKHGLHHQVSITLMALPPGCEGAHDPDFYEKTLRDILDQEIPFDSVCFKDASGTATPSTVFETVIRARKLLPEGTYLHYHTHDTAGIAVQANMAALEAGADAIDLSFAPCSGGTCQVDVLTMWHALRGTDFKLDIDIDKIREAEDVFMDCMKDYYLPPEATKVEPMIPWCPMPGGALTANTQMLRDNGIMNKYPEIIRAMGDVVRKGGFGTSVTPVSQFYFQQAFNNVMHGPWEKISGPFGKMVLGYFGKTPCPADPEIVALASEQLGLESTDEHPINRNNKDPKKGIAAAEEWLKNEGLKANEENIFIVASCGEKGITFLKGEAEVMVRKNMLDQQLPTSSTQGQLKPRPDTAAVYEVKVDGDRFEVEIEGDRVTVDGQDVPVRVMNATKPVKKKRDQIRLICQASGYVFKVRCRAGDVVKEGETLIVLESLKMEMSVKAPVDGTVMDLPVYAGDEVSSGQILAVIKQSDR